MTDRPLDPDNPDTEGSTVPPYEGRRESGDIAGKEQSVKDGAKTAGAANPVEDDEMKAPDPADTERGAVGSPGDEQPASEMRETEGDDEGVGPAHHPGTSRGEDAGA